MLACSALWRWGIEYVERFAVVGLLDSDTLAANHRICHMPSSPTSVEHDSLQSLTKFNAASSRSYDLGVSIDSQDVSVHPWLNHSTLTMVSPHLQERALDWRCFVKVILPARLSCRACDRDS